MRDIEDVVVMGKRSCVCPYYATRRAVKQAQVWFLLLGFDVDNRSSSRYRTTFCFKRTLEKRLTSICGIRLSLSMRRIVRIHMSLYYDKYTLILRRPYRYTPLHPLDDSYFHQPVQRRVTTPTIPSPIPQSSEARARTLDTSDAHSSTRPCESM